MPTLPGKPKKPWPMKWVVLAVAVFILVDTYVMIHYRKPGPSFEPYHDIREEAVTLKLLKGGYQRLKLDPRQPIRIVHFDVPPPVASAGGLPARLEAHLYYQPTLPESYQEVSAPGRVASNKPFLIQFHCLLPAGAWHLTDVRVYIHQDVVTIAPSLVKGRDRSGESGPTLAVEIEVPRGRIKPGRYQVTLAGRRSSLAWPLQVD